MNQVALCTVASSSYHDEVATHHPDFHLRWTTIRRHAASLQMANQRLGAIATEVRSKLVSIRGQIESGLSPLTKTRRSTVAI
jgi:hypothetical protein